MFIIILFQGNEQVVFLATSPGLTSSYGPANPMELSLARIVK